MKSLEKLLELKPAVIYPGHGIMLSNPIEVIENYIKHRQQREKQILGVLQGSEPMTSVDIVRKVYVVSFIRTFYGH